MTTYFLKDALVLVPSKWLPIINLGGWELTYFSSFRGAKELLTISYCLLECSWSLSIFFIIYLHKVLIIKTQVFNTFIYVIKNLKKNFITSFLKRDIHVFFKTNYSIIVNYICFARGGIANKNCNIRFWIKFI